MKTGRLWHIQTILGLTWNIDYIGKVVLFDAENKFTFTYQFYSSSLYLVAFNGLG